MILQEVRENELFVQRLHQRLAIHGGHRADDRRVLEFLLVGCKGQDHRRAGHNNDILLGFIRSGKENVKLIGGRLGGRTPEFDILREAGAHLAAVALVADQKETPPASSASASHPRRGEPMMFCSIVGRRYPVFAVSSGINTTADSPAKSTTTSLQLIIDPIIADCAGFV